MPLWKPQGQGCESSSLSFPEGLGASLEQRLWSLSSVLGTDARVRPSRRAGEGAGLQGVQPGPRWEGRCPPREVFVEDRSPEARSAPASSPQPRSLLSPTLRPTRTGLKLAGVTARLTGSLPGQGTHEQGLRAQDPLSLGHPL